MAGTLIAERLYEEEAGAGGPARYVLYAAAAAAALVGAWLVAAPASQPDVVPEPLAARMLPMPTETIARIELKPTEAALAEAPKTASLDKLPPKPIPRPAVAQRPTQPSPAYVATGAPPAVLATITETVPSAPAVVAAPMAVEPAIADATPSDGPVPPMPIEAQAEPPAGSEVHHGGLLGLGERTVGTAWNWSTGAVGGIVDGVKRTF